MIEQGQHKGGWTAQVVFAVDRQHLTSPNTPFEDVRVVKCNGTACLHI